MHKLLKHAMVLFLVATLIALPFCSAAVAQVEFEPKKPSAGAMTYDLVILRPVGILASASCAVIYVFALPFALIGGNVKTATQQLVVAPLKFTFPRPLGAF
jgi:hypothetical protein